MTHARVRGHGSPPCLLRVVRARPWDCDFASRAGGSRRSRRVDRPPHVLAAGARSRTPHVLRRMSDSVEKRVHFPKAIRDSKLCLRQIALWEAQTCTRFGTEVAGVRIEDRCIQRSARETTPAHAPHPNVSPPLVRFDEHLRGSHCKPRSVCLRCARARLEPAIVALRLVWRPHLLRLTLLEQPQSLIPKCCSTARGDAASRAAAAGGVRPRQSGLVLGKL